MATAQPPATAGPPAIPIPTRMAPVRTEATPPPTPNPQREPPYTAATATALLGSTPAALLQEVTGAAVDLASFSFPLLPAGTAAYSDSAKDRSGSSGSGSGNNPRGGTQRHNDNTTLKALKKAKEDAQQEKRGHRRHPSSQSSDGADSVGASFAATGGSVTGGAPAAAGAVPAAAGGGPPVLLYGAAGSTAHPGVIYNYHAPQSPRSTPVGVFAASSAAPPAPSSNAVLFPPPPMSAASRSHTPQLSGAAAPLPGTTNFGDLLTLPPDAMAAATAATFGGAGTLDRRRSLRHGALSLVAPSSPVLLPAGNGGGPPFFGAGGGGGGGGGGGATMDVAEQQGGMPLIFPSNAGQASWAGFVPPSDAMARPMPMAPTTSGPAPPPTARPPPPPTRGRFRYYEPYTLPWIGNEVKEAALCVVGGVKEAVRAAAEARLRLALHPPPVQRRAWLLAAVLLLALANVLYAESRLHSLRVHRAAAAVAVAKALPLVFASEEAFQHGVSRVKAARTAQQAAVRRLENHEGVSQTPSSRDALAKSLEVAKVGVVREVRALVGLHGARQEALAWLCAAATGGEPCDAALVPLGDLLGLALEHRPAPTAAVVVPPTTTAAPAVDPLSLPEADDGQTGGSGCKAGDDCPVDRPPFSPDEVKADEHVVLSDALPAGDHADGVLRVDGDDTTTANNNKDVGGNQSSDDSLGIAAAAAPLEEALETLFEAPSNTAAVGTNGSMGQQETGDNSTVISRLNNSEAAVENIVNFTLAGSHAAPHEAQSSDVSKQVVPPGGSSDTFLKAAAATNDGLRSVEGHRSPAPPAAAKVASPEPSKKPMGGLPASRPDGQQPTARKPSFGPVRPPHFPLHPRKNESSDAGVGVTRTTSTAAHQADETAAVAGSGWGRWTLQCLWKIVRYVAFFVLVGVFLRMS